MDYRYFPDPDLPPLVIDEAWIELVRRAMPESQAAMKARFVRDCGLSAYDAGLLSASRATGDYFEACVAATGGASKLVANWINGALAAVLNQLQVPIERGPITVDQLSALINRIRDGTISGKAAKEVFDELVTLWQRRAAGEADSLAPTAALTAAAHVDQIVAARGLQQISDTGAIERIVDEVLAANAALVADYRSGKDKAFNALVGQVMKASKGSANPAQANALLKKKLGA